MLHTVVGFLSLLPFALFQCFPHYSKHREAFSGRATKGFWFWWSGLEELTFYFEQTWWTSCFTSQLVLKSIASFLLTSSDKRALKTFEGKKKNNVQLRQKTTRLADTTEARKEMRLSFTATPFSAQRCKILLGLQKKKKKNIFVESSWRYFQLGKWKAANYRARGDSRDGGVKNGGRQCRNRAWRGGRIPGAIRRSGRSLGACHRQYLLTSLPSNWCAIKKKKRWWRQRKLDCGELLAYSSSFKRSRGSLFRQNDDKDRLQTNGLSQSAGSAPSARWRRLRREGKTIKNDGTACRNLRKKKSFLIFLIPSQHLEAPRCGNPPHNVAQSHAHLFFSFPNKIWLVGFFLRPTLRSFPEPRMALDAASRSDWGIAVPLRRLRIPTAVASINLSTTVRRKDPQI